MDDHIKDIGDESDVGDVDGKSQDDDWDDWEEDITSSCLCLFCSASLPSPAETMQHCKAIHSFDISRVKRDLDLDIYRHIRLVNFIRTVTSESEARLSWTDSPFCSITKDHPLFTDDAFLIPVIHDDPLLYSLDEDETDSVADDKASELMKRLVAAEERAKQAEDDVRLLQGLLLDSKELLHRALLEEGKAENPPSIKDDGGKESHVEADPDEGGGDSYFVGYAHFGIHEEMLKDTVRTESYRDAIYLNKPIFKDKVVLDVGCGTGILSMFAARAGARQVIGIDRSDIIHKARNIVQSNKLEGIITLIRGEAEKVVLPVEKVDIIISEWMGYFLLYESMLDTVLFARDKWLKPGGIVQPCRVELKLTALACEDFYFDKVDYWQEVYGFSLKCMQESIFAEPHVAVMPDDCVLTDSATLKNFDIMQMNNQDQEFSSPFRLVVKRADTCFGFAGYFDADFSWKNVPFSNGVQFSTSPHDTPTHWKQTIFLISEPHHDLAEGDVIAGNLTCRKNSKRKRHLDIFIEWWVERNLENGEVVKRDLRSQNYYLG